MKVLVTGSEGFIGRHLVRELASDEVEVIGFDLKNGHDLLCCELPDVFRVFHLAAQTDARSTATSRDARDNIMVTIRLCERYGSRIVFASTSMVNYPVVPYAISKRAAEAYVLAAGGAVVRFCNIYGEGGHSVIEAFGAADELSIYGDGEQRRTYAPVEGAVDALLQVRPGQTFMLRGDDLSVNQIAARMFPMKPRRYLPARANDLLDARQVA